MGKRSLHAWGRALRKTRVELGLTQVQVGVEAGYSRSNAQGGVSRVELGNALDPSLYRQVQAGLKRLANGRAPRRPKGSVLVGRVDKAEIELPADLSASLVAAPSSLQSRMALIREHLRLIEGWMDEVVKLIGGNGEARK